MSKSIIVLFLVTSLFITYKYYGSTTAPVVLAGGIIKAKTVEDVTKKYKRKDCPVCNGKGWYMSGDKIKKIECSYCEPDKNSISIGEIISINPTPKTFPKQIDNCPNGQCKPNTIIRR